MSPRAALTFAIDSPSVRTVLLIAYHFPPVAGSSGLQRTLRFAQYLPEFGWNPIVLTVQPNAYEEIDERSLAQIPAGCEVVRTRCLDAGRHLSVFGRYPRFATLPDRWASWRWWAVRTGRRLIRDRNIAALWSTYPIATAHKIGAEICARTGVPWIADFRDPMAQEGYPRDARRRLAFKCIEESVAAHAARWVFVSPSARRMYAERYPQVPDERLLLIENGFDESSFEGLAANPSAAAQARPVLLHSGIVYPSERDPAALFEALARLHKNAKIRPGDFVIRFRAPVHESMLEELARAHAVQAYVEVKPALPYREALQEMLDASALVVMQGSNCNEQIPAKLYEYLRAGRPILGLADPAGDTGRALATSGCAHVAALESADAIERLLPGFIAQVRAGALPATAPATIERYSRRTLTGLLAAALDEVAAGRPQFPH